jgi:hypothetical protein
VPSLIAVVLAILGGALAAPHLQTACSPRARAALARVESTRPGSVRADPFKASSGAAGCQLRGQDVAAVVRLDSAPQAYARMEREVVEFGQNVDWTKVPPRAYPRTIAHLGLDADWFPLQSRLLTTDGVRLITIKVRAESMAPSARKAAATDLARVYLGPLHHP